MMYVITHDLHQGIFHNYQPFFQEIKNLGAWCKYMDRTWIVVTDLPLEEITNRLTQHLGQPDRLLIVRVEKSYIDRPYSGWLPREEWDWINKVYDEYY